MVTSEDFEGRVTRLTVQLVVKRFVRRLIWHLIWKGRYLNSIFLEGLSEALAKPTVSRVTVFTLVPSKEDRYRRYIEGEWHQAMAEDCGIVLGQTLWNGQDKIGSGKYGGPTEKWDRQGDAESSAGLESLR